MLRTALIACALALGACAPSAANAPIAEQWRSIEVLAAPIEWGAARAGALAFRGGLALSSDDASFGGLSGLEALDDGRFLAISDNGAWFEGRFRLSEDGALIGVDEIRAATMRDEAGQPFETKRAGDSEGLAQLPDGRFAVSFEQTQTIRIYDLNRDGPFGAASPGPAIEGASGLPDNVGLEALAADGEGALLVGAEGGGEGSTLLWRARLGAQAPAGEPLRYRLPRGFSLTGLDRLPDGDFVAVERFYAPVVGARVRITRFAPPARGEAAPEELALLAAPLPVDNFEGVSAVRMPGGATRLYIVADDNFSPRQRTLLLAFDVAE